MTTGDEHPRCGLRPVVLAFLALSVALAFRGEGNAIAGTQPWERGQDNPLFTSGAKTGPGGTTIIAMGDASVHYDEQEGKWRMWFGAGYPHGAGARVGAQYAESTDGVSNWAVDSGLALNTATSSKAWDHNNAETPAVVKNPDASAPASRRYLLWYSGANDKRRKVFKKFSYYQIGLAFSADGRHFKRLPARESPYGKAGLDLVARDAFPGNRKVKDGVVADPEVVVKDGVFHLWFSAIGLDRRGRAIAAGIGYATSRDGVHWKAYRKNPVLGPVAMGKEYPPPGQPTVLWNPAKGGFEMWFTNDSAADRKGLPDQDVGTIGYWYAFSSNGKRWTTFYPQGRAFTWDASFPFEASGIQNGPEAVLTDGQYRMYYAGFGTKNIPPDFGQSIALEYNLATLAG